MAKEAETPAQLTDPQEPAPDHFSTGSQLRTCPETPPGFAHQPYQSQSSTALTSWPTAPEMTRGLVFTGQQAPKRPVH